MNYNIQDLKPFGTIVESSNRGENIGNVPISLLREIVGKSRLLVLRGFKGFQSADEFAQYCENWGEVSLWPFGKVLELKEQTSPEDHIFDHSYVPLHWDGMYRPQVPEFQVFHCVSAPKGDQGGRTTFSNTAQVVDRLPKKTLDKWSGIYGVYQRKMEYYDSKTRAPIVAQHPYREDLRVIRYCESPQEGDESFVNHPNFQFEGLTVDEVREFQDSLRKELYSPENFYAHQWQTGDIVISDNHTLLHGREAFTSGAPRHIQRVHVNGKGNLANPHLVYHS